MNKFFAPLVAVLLLSVPAAQAMATGIVLAPGTDNVLVGDNDQGIHIDGTDVVIDNVGRLARGADFHYWPVRWR